ncbi:hypothetical protein ABT160_29855 [Streptomyces sp. NPDC001941]|uniref:hypothetical protein n=1 Tax=Streptomyces sp. NPDC001941 TaxID=3154659 RepID=UPI00331E7B98
MTNTDSTPAHPNNTPTDATADAAATPGDTTDLRHLLTLPADQRPAWLNEFIGTMTIPPIPDTSTNPLLDVVMANTAHTPLDCLLAFPLDQVLALAEHATACDHHHLGYEETQARPRLWWVKSDGTYLTSNGHAPHPAPTPAPAAVHADGWGPGTDARTILGGDDFRQSLDLTTPINDDGTTLLDLLRQATADGATRFLLQATLRTDDMDLTYITE